MVSSGNFVDQCLPRCRYENRPSEKGAEKCIIESSIGLRQCEGQSGVRWGTSGWVAADDRPSRASRAADQTRVVGNILMGPNRSGRYGRVRRKELRTVDNVG